MSLAVGFNFRATSGFVTDGANESAVLGDLFYPSSYGNGATAGWNSLPSTIDINNTVDRRLAGCNFTGPVAGAKTFTVDLPSTGSYILDLAYGPGPFGFTLADQKILIIDDPNGTPVTLATLGPHTISTSHVRDAADLDNTVANWPTLKTTATFAFASTHLGIQLVPTAASDNVQLQHLFVTQVVAVGLGGWGRPEVDWAYY